MALSPPFPRVYALGKLTATIHPNVWRSSFALNGNLLPVTRFAIHGAVGDDYTRVELELAPQDTDEITRIAGYLISDDPVGDIPVVPRFVGAPLKTSIIGMAVWEKWPDCGRIKFSDDSTVVSAPQDDAEYAARAYALGYKEPNARLDMAREHDAIHMAVANALGYDESAVVWAIAHGVLNDMEPSSVLAEESLVLAATAYLNEVRDEHEPALEPLRRRGVDLARWRTAVLGDLRDSA